MASVIGGGIAVVAATLASGTGDISLIFIILFYFIGRGGVCAVLQ